MTRAYSLPGFAKLQNTPASIVIIIFGAKSIGGCVRGRSRVPVTPKPASSDHLQSYRSIVRKLKKRNCGNWKKGSTVRKLYIWKLAPTLSRDMKIENTKICGTHWFFLLLLTDCLLPDQHCFPHWSFNHQFRSFKGLLNAGERFDIQFTNLTLEHFVSGYDYMS